MIRQQEVFWEAYSLMMPALLSVWFLWAFRN